MPRKQADVERALSRKGFVQSESHHRFFIYHSKAGRKTPIKTKTSHGQREISDSLLSKMAQQVKLGRGEFLDLVDCPLSRDEYEEKLVALNLVDATA
jgi:predicted RNA binding protein YcfA (HicA-like mRNA interferase family)